MSKRQFVKDILCHLHLTLPFFFSFFQKDNCIAYFRAHHFDNEVFILEDKNFSEAH